MTSRYGFSFIDCFFLYEIRVGPSEYLSKQWLVFNLKSFAPQDVFEVRQRRVVSFDKRKDFVSLPGGHFLI